MTDINTLFDMQVQSRKRAALKATVRRIELSLSKRLMYEIGGREGYDVEPLNEILLMIRFSCDSQRDEFLMILREELDNMQTLSLGASGPYGTTVMEVVRGPTGTYFRNI
jgi:hypothetical protein